MEKEKNIIIMVNWNLKVNVQMEKNLMEKNMIIMVNQFLKMNI